MAWRLSNSKLKPLTLTITLFLVLANFRLYPHRDPNLRIPNKPPEDIHMPPPTKLKPRWLDHALKNESIGKKLKIGLVNMEDDLGENTDDLRGLVDVMEVPFRQLSSKDLRWEDLFPEWIDEDGAAKCPEIPMPEFGDFQGLDMVVARVPCGRSKREGIRDVFRLQVSLVVANLLVWSGKENSQAMFVGSCGPIIEIFRCDDLVWHEGDYWVYRPNLKRLKPKVLMPFGTCQLAPIAIQPDEKEGSLSPNINRFRRPREAYVTILHSSEAYVCGAIALAQSIIQTNSTKDLVLLADHSISPKSLLGLKAAGWKLKHIERIRSPHAPQKAYNKWNYSKLRVWQLIKYDKIIFIDADLLVLDNIDKFFLYPQLSATGNDKFLFNSGIMLVEPSTCMFKTLMENRFRVSSYNGGDQGFLNEIFTWWHRWPRRLNSLKIFKNASDLKHEITDKPYAIHYLGLKPWMCYEDYDCNWDKFSHHIYASDSAHQRWWNIYKSMPKKLKPFCRLTERMDARIRKWRWIARNGSLSDGHWKIKVKDHRRHIN